MSINLIDLGMAAQAASIGKEPPQYDISKEACPRCDGSGFAESQHAGGGTSTGTCWRCAGRGTVEFKRPRKEQP